MCELLRFLRIVCRTNRPLAVSIAACRIGGAVIPLAMTWTWILVLEQMVRVAAGHRIDARMIWLLIVTEAVLAVAGVVVSRCAVVATGALGERVQTAMSVAIMRTAGRWSLEEIENPAALDALERARRQSNVSLAPFVAVGTISQESLSIALFMLLFAWLSPWMVVALIVVAIPECVGEVYFGQKARDIASRRAPERRYLDYLRYIAASGQTAKEVRAFRLTEHLVQLYQEVTGRLKIETVALERRRSLAGLVLGSAAIVGQYVAYALAIAQFLDGRLLIGSLVFIVRGLTRVRHHVTRLSEAISVLAQEWPTMRDLLTYVDGTPDLPQPDDQGARLPEVQSMIELDGVSFRYAGAERWALRDVSATFKRGQVTLIVGENGAGKSTLVRLLARLCEPTEGRMLIDGEDSRRYARSQTGDRTSVLFQDFTKYDFRAGDNVALGNIESRDDVGRIREAARRAGADNVIAQLANGYEQMLGRRFSGGVNLSGGQWQRLALARAYMRNADLLILDEPTASLDPLSETHVLRQIAAEATNRIIVVVSHKRATAKIADHVVVISNGLVVEQGPPDELLAAGGRYARWYQFQQAGAARAGALDL